jgi:hypothetical protein
MPVSGILAISTPTPLSVGAAAAVLVHVPTWPARLHRIDGSVQAVSQQTLSTQLRDAHCPAAVQLEPLGCGVGVLVGVTLGLLRGVLLGVPVGVPVGVSVGVPVGVAVGGHAQSGSVPQPLSVPHGAVEHEPPKFGPVHCTYPMSPWAQTIPRPGMSQWQQHNPSPHAERRATTSSASHAVSATSGSDAYRAIPPPITAPASDPPRLDGRDSWVSMPQRMGVANVRQCDARRPARSRRLPPARHRSLMIQPTGMAR